MPEKIRVGLIGCGNISRAHLGAYRDLSEHFEVVAVADIVADKARERAAEFGVPRAVRHIDELCAMPDLDVIDITAPPYTHMPFAMQAAEAGKDVFVEKPAGGSLAEIDAMAACEQRTGRRIVPTFNYRYGFAVQRMQHLLRLGIPGKAYLSTVETHWRREAPYFNLRWRMGWRTALGGAFIGHAIHAHDILYRLIGPARSVFAHAKALVNPTEVEDTLSVSLEMADGSLAALSVTFGSWTEITRHRYCFENLTAESNTSPYAGHTSDPWTFIGRTPAVDDQIKEALAGFTPQPPEGFVGQFARYYQAARHGAPLPTCLADARAAIELTTAVYYSADTRQVVDLPLGSDHPYYAGCIPAGAASLESLTDYEHYADSPWKPTGV
jgi:predicted dehydrogenase